MAQSTSVDSSTQVDEIVFMAEDVRPSIKKEDEILVKHEPVECVVCATRNNETYDMFNTKTNAGQSLHQFICKFTLVDVSDLNNCSKSVCKSCFDLINVLQQAEIEYIKLKESFEAIISKNPLFETHSVQPIQLGSVKNELYNGYEDNSFDNNDNDSEDEPLAVTRKKRHRKIEKVKKKSNVVNKRKSRSKTNDNSSSWECNECGEHGDTGGVVAETAHRLAAHTASADASLTLHDIIKKEDSPDRSQSPHYNFKIEFDDDTSSSYTPEEANKEETKASKRTKLIAAHHLKTKIRKKRDVKIIHKCDQCDSKFTSIQRLQQHKLRHEDSKPPYICEVCGAHYKHKRACDIHVALHKGISDWKCEECNKLFPSKGALKRHNNIHTGKLNYQCDLCGKSFIHTSSFKMHKLSHSGVKPHACDVCGLALMTRSHLKRHKRVHSGEKRHECPVCGKRFSERYNLAAHSKSHETTTPVPQPAPRRRLFRCHFCSERFERRYMLERHMPAAHGRPLERPPPTPRNTMSKLLKAQAQARSARECDTKKPAGTSPPPPPTTRSPSTDAPKLFAHLTSGASSAPVTTWSGAYAAEFGLRTDFH